MKDEKKSVSILGILSVAQVLLGVTIFSLKFQSFPCLDLKLYEQTQSSSPCCPARALRLAEHPGVCDQIQIKAGAPSKPTTHYLIIVACEKVFKLGVVNRLRTQHPHVPVAPACCTIPLSCSHIYSLSVVPCPASSSSSPSQGNYSVLI